MSAWTLVTPPPIPEGDTPRLQRARQVRALRGDGLTYREIAGRLGMTRSNATDLNLDPSGERRDARHEKARGACIGCGAPTSWAGGSGAPVRCRRCAPAAVEPLWTREAVIAALQDFHEREGRVPSMREMGTTGNTLLGLPCFTVLYARFGTPRAAMLAAGLTPRRQGERLPS